MNGRVFPHSFPFFFHQRMGLQRVEVRQKLKKKRENIESPAKIRVFQPPLCLFQKAWMPEPMQETAWSSGGRAAGGRFQSFPPPVDLDRSVHRQESYEPRRLLMSAAMHHFRGRSRPRPSLCSRCCHAFDARLHSHCQQPPLVYYSNNARSKIDSMSAYYSAVRFRISQKI